jgi:hypothetical protein
LLVFLELMLWHMACLQLSNRNPNSLETTMFHKTTLLAATLLGVGILSISPANAATSYSWTFSSGGCTSQGTNTWGNTCTDTTSTPTGGPVLTGEGFSNTGTGGILQTAHSQFYSGGIGVNNRNISGGAGESISVAPNHAIDNQDNVDSLLLSFTGVTTPVALTSLTSGWTGTDADFDLLRYTGSGDPTTALGGTTGANGTLTYATLLSNGWSYVGQYSFASNVSSGTTSVNVNSGALTSSYWLVLADTSFTGHAALGGYDYFKVLGAAATYTPPQGGSVPEPGSLALLGLGTLLMVRARSKKPS